MISRDRARHADDVLQFKVRSLEHGSIFPSAAVVLASRCPPAASFPESSVPSCPAMSRVLSATMPSLKGDRLRREPDHHFAFPDHSPVAM